MEVRNRNSGAQQHSHPRALLLEWAPPRANVLAASERLMIKKTWIFLSLLFSYHGTSFTAAGSAWQDILGKVSCLCGYRSHRVSDRFPHFIFALQGRVFTFEISRVNFRAWFGASFSSILRLW